MNSNVKAKTTTHLNPPSLARARGQLKNESTYDEFILWFALPKYEKVRMRLETQEQFAGYHHLNRHTISEWKKRLDFYPRLKELRNTWGRDRTHNVIVALYHGAISDRPSAARDRELWLKYVEGWREGQVPPKQEPVIHYDDIRFGINALPEPYRSQAYDHLNRISDLLTLHGDDSYTDESTPQAPAAAPQSVGI